MRYELLQGDNICFQGLPSDGLFGYFLVRETIDRGRIDGELILSNADGEPCFSFNVSIPTGCVIREDMIRSKINGWPVFVCEKDELETDSPVIVEGKP